MSEMKRNRQFLHSGDWEGLKDSGTDQQREKPVPPQENPAPDGVELLDLIPVDEFKLGAMGILDVMRQRRSRRLFTAESLTLEELSYLLWSTQGVERVIRDGVATLRTAPSGGARHPFETYLWINRVDGLEEGLYRYLPLKHKLYKIESGEGFPERLNEACLGQKFVGGSAVVFMWAAIPYRAEWRYALVSHKMILLDAGHVCQNLYLAAESIGCGTCAIGAFSQEKIDALLNLDGDDEFIIYISPVGRVKQ